MIGCSMHNVLCMCTNTQVWREDSPMQCSLQADFGWSHWLATSKLLHSSHSHIKGMSYSEDLLDRYVLCTCTCIYARENTEPWRGLGHKRIYREKPLIILCYLHCYNPFSHIHTICLYIFQIFPRWRSLHAMPLSSSMCAMENYPASSIRDQQIW